MQQQTDCQTQLRAAHSEENAALPPLAAAGEQNSSTIAGVTKGAEELPEGMVEQSFFDYEGTILFAHHANKFPET